MKTLLVSRFKANCIALLKEVQRTREPLLITLRGKPLAMVHPAAPSSDGKRLGGLKGRMIIRRDLVNADTTRDWSMLRESRHTERRGKTERG